MEIKVDCIFLRERMYVCVLSPRTFKENFYLIRIFHINSHIGHVFIYILFLLFVHI